MSLCLKDPDRIKQSIAEIHSSSSCKKWILCGRLKDSTSVLRLIETGSGGLEEISSHLVDNEMMMVIYGLINLGDSFIFVTWYNMSFGKRLTSYSREIAVLFMPYHRWIHIDLKSNSVNLSDILEEKDGNNHSAAQTNNSRQLLQSSILQCNS